jgi:putative ABC transport system permease protein
MSIFTLVWNYLKARPLNTAINILLLSLGIAVITILLLFNKQLEQKITENARGIDLVVGAKGSPLSLPGISNSTKPNDSRNTDL